MFSRGTSWYFLGPSAAKRLSAFARCRAAAVQKVHLHCRHKSTTHAVHSELKSMGDPEKEALQKSVTKAMAMGMPVETAVDKKGFHCPHKATCAPTSFSRQAEGLARPRKAKPVRVEKDTFASKIPMKWAVAGGHATTYVACPLLLLCRGSGGLRQLRNSVLSIGPTARGEAAHRTQLARAHSKQWTLPQRGGNRLYQWS